MSCSHGGGSGGKKECGGGREIAVAAVRGGGGSSNGRKLGVRVGRVKVGRGVDDGGCGDESMRMKMIVQRGSG